MPISKKGNLYYTEEQYQQARYNSSALEYAQTQGYELVQDGAYYHMKEHDSMIFTSRGNWFWNSRGLSGRAIEFQMYYENKTVTEAVLTLCGENAQQQAPSPAVHARDRPAVPAAGKAPEAREFVPPPRSENFKRLFGYLCGARGLDKSVVQNMINQRVLYESIHPMRNGGEAHNACFLSFDNKGRPCGAFERGTSTFGHGYKGEAPGSDKSHGWLFHGGEDIHAVAVFEAAIDAASYASLCRMSHSNAGENLDYLALGGLDDKALFNYLAAHPEIRDVALCLDADKWGRAATERIQQKLTKQGYMAVDITDLPEGCKDWNDFLIQFRRSRRPRNNSSRRPSQSLRRKRLK